MNNKIIVGLGEALWDCLPEGRKIGGAPANFAYHASQFGFEAYAVSAVGNDALGDETIEALKSNGLKLEMPRVDFPTGQVQVTLDEDGVASYDIREGSAWDNIPFTPEIEALAKQCKAVCFGSLAQRNAVTRSTVQKFLDTMSPIGTLKVFDINLRQHWYSKEIIEGSLIRCNVLKLNDEEIVTVSELLGLGKVPCHTDESPLQLVDFEDQCHEIMQRYELQMLILTCGINGSYVFCSDGRVSFQPTPKVDVADTVGAGDSFTGSFVASLLKGKSMEEAHRRAVEVSAYVCT